MQTSLKTVVTAEIFLNDDERFIVKPPSGLRTFRIHLIEVHNGYFRLYGDSSWRKRHESDCLPVQYTYTDVEEVPEMPFLVASEVRRCLTVMHNRSKVA